MYVASIKKGVALLPFCLLALGLVFLCLGLLSDDLTFLRKTATYGNFDEPSQNSFVQSLLPGLLKDYAHEKVYSFGSSLHRAPLVSMGLLFLVFFFLAWAKNPDGWLGTRRWLSQWSAFVLSRLGVLRVSGAFPLARCTFGVFPFLNCQACEMATGLCPIGSLQTSLVSLRFPSLLLGWLLIIGVSVGRWPCGWLCPFGLVSDIMDKVSLRRLSLHPRYGLLKFFLLAALVFIALFMGLRGWKEPLAFCSTICPSGLIYGLLPYYATTGSSGFQEVVGQPGAHPWQFSIILFHGLMFVVFFLLLLFISGRFFCRVLCPLGAFLGLFNPVSLVKVTHEGERCLGCKKCQDICPMGIDLSQKDFLTHSNCIRCKKCLHLCPNGARQWSSKGGNLFLLRKERGFPP